MGLLLRPEEEVCPPLAPACHPPQHPSLPLLVGSKVCRRRAERFRAVPELRGAHPDVPLLPAGSLRPLPEALPLVEEVPHHHPARAVRPRFLPRTAAAHLHVRLPSGCILDVRRHRSPVLHSLHGLLQTGVLQEEVDSEGGQERQLGRVERTSSSGERGTGERTHGSSGKQRNGPQATQVGLTRYQHYCMEEHSLEALTTMTVFEYL